MATGKSGKKDPKNPRDEDNGPDEASHLDDQHEIHDEDFQFALKALLEAYQPVLEKEVARAKNPGKLTGEALKDPPDCDDEFALATQIAKTFFTEKVALRLLPAEGREHMGPIDRWRWCFLHLRCCIIFGWLLCRRPQTFRSTIYYLYRYWLCVRRVLGIAPDDRALNEEEREDLNTLVREFAAAYKPYLSDQLATVEFSEGLSAEVLTGEIDCEEGEDEAGAFVERALTMKSVEALLGKEAFEQHRKEPFFWFCRCWCLCAIRFGCCLARASNLVDVLRCLLYFWRCIRDCFRPLICDLTGPEGCTDEELNPKVGGLTIPVEGTATGAFFDHYEIEWRKVESDAGCDDDAGWSSDDVVYPGGGGAGTAPVNSGVLGWLNTTTWSAGAYEVRVCVYQTNGARRCCCTTFSLFKRLVWIDHVGGASVETPPGPFAPKAPIVTGNPGGVVVPVGCCVTVRGSAFVGDCNDRKIKCFDLRYGIGFLPGPNQVGFNPAAYSGSLLDPFGPVCYTPPDESGKRAQWNQVIAGALTTRLVQTEIEILGTTIKVWKLKDFCFNSANGLPPCPDPQHACRSGKYTLLLDVEDTLGNHYYDTQHVWFDNKPIHVEFNGLEGVKSCEDVNLGAFVPGGAPCAAQWPMNLLGIVYDEYIDPADLSYPSDNLDYYSLTITRQGGPSYSVPITPDLVNFHPDPLTGVVDVHKGRKRVGDPGTRCEEAVPGCPAPPHPAKFADMLTKIDLRIFDDGCVGSLGAPFKPPAGFALKRGTCCGYTFQLYAQDRTRSDGGTGLCHRKWSLPWAVCICNDLPHEDEDQPG